MKRIAVIFLAVALLLAVALPVYAQPVGGRHNTPIVIYVESQGLYYQSVAGPNLPWNPNIEHTFQELWGTPPDDLYTDYGPGDPEYKGGRWWVDSNPNGYQDAGDDFFECPLLGPGQEEAP